MIFNFITSFFKKIFYRPVAEEFWQEQESMSDVDVPKKTFIEKKKRKNHKKTLVDLLENIEFAFDSIKMPTKWAWSHTHPDTVIGLRKIGPHIRSTYSAEKWEPQTKLKTLNGKWASMMFVAYKNYDRDDGYLSAAFSYAVLCKKPPYYVSNPLHLTIYECGGAWRDKDEKRIMWANWYVGVNKKTGDVSVLKYLQDQKVNLTKGKSRHKQYTKRIWTEPPMAYAESPSNPKGYKDLDWLKTVFVDCFESWQLMENTWKVSVKKDNQRVTWAIDQSETKTFFKDREAVVDQGTGKKKKIIHFVSQHERITADGKKSTVREHIRGINKFDWRGYAVNVIAPKFQINIQEFDALPKEDDAPLTNEDIAFSLLGKKLADIEDSTVRKPLPTIH